MDCWLDWGEMNYKQGLVISVYMDSDLLRCIYVTQVPDVISKISLGYMEDERLSICASRFVSERDMPGQQGVYMWQDTAQHK